MATFNATFVRRLAQGNRGAEHAIPAGKGAIGLEAVITAGTAQALQRDGAAWEADGDGFLICWSSDGASRLGVGETPASGSSPVGHYVGDGLLYTVAVERGQGAEVITA